MNFLEQLVAEWYVYRGYFVLTNVKHGKRKKGGWEGEIDVLAFEAKKPECVHVETSMDADSWAERKRRFRRKFETAGTHYAKLFPCPAPQVRQIAVVGFTQPKDRPDFGEGIEVRFVPELIAEICADLKEKHPMTEAVPEGFPLLRAMQFAVHYGSARKA